MTSYKETPLSFSGEVWQEGSGFNHKVFVVLDTTQGVFKHYSSRSNHVDDLPADFQVAIQEIHSVTLSHNQQSKECFVIKTRNASIAYYCEFEDMSSEWYKKILESINFYHLYLCETDSGKNARNIEEEAKCVRSDASDVSETASSYTDTVVNEDSFEKIEELGAGAFGKVHKVVKKDTGEYFAMKVLRKSVLKSRNLLKYAATERRTLKNIVHPFIISLLWGFESKTHVFMVMEYCPYGDFANIMSNYKTLQESIARFYISEVILAIEHVHSLNIVYRDLKPSNLLIDRYGHIKLGDFGLAKENVTEENPAMSFCGTYAYLPPEVLTNSGSSKSADIYLIGVNLFEMVTGKSPFFTLDLGALYKAIINSKVKFPAGLSEDIKDLIASTMHKNPSQRPTIQKIKEHKFFKGVDWGAVYRRETEPPISVDDLKKFTPIDCTFEKNIYDPII